MGDQPAAKWALRSLRVDVVVFPVRRTGCDEPMDIENGNWIIQSMYADFRFGVQVSYECDPGFKVIGQTDITCLATGYWSDYPPKCLQKGRNILSRTVAK